MGRAPAQPLALGTAAVWCGVSCIPICCIISGPSKLCTQSVVSQPLLLPSHLPLAMMGRCFKSTCGAFKIFLLKGGFISAERAAHASGSDLPHNRAASPTPLLHTCFPSQSIGNIPFLFFPLPKRKIIMPSSFQHHWPGQGSKCGVPQGDIPVTEGAVW